MELSQQSPLSPSPSPAPAPYTPQPSPWPARIAALSGLCAFWVGYLAQNKVVLNQQMGLRLFIFGGFLLLLARPGLKASPGSLGEIPWARQPRQAWEPWFLLALTAFAFVFRFYGLDEFPPGAHGHEGEMASHAMQIEKGSYMPHVYESDILWPSMSFYQGLAFSKVFGWVPSSLRMPGALWGVLSIPLFYFMVRMVAAPWVAATAALLFNASQLHLAISRNLFPGAMLFVSPVAAFAFLLAAMRDGKRRYFYAAGFAAGISMHGFVPGRTVGVLFALWFAWLYLTAPKSFPGFKAVLIFFAGYLSSGLPVIHWALNNWGIYNAYVGGHDPQRGGGIMAYWRGFTNELPTYARWFHVLGDVSSAEDIARHPGVDRVTGVLFPVGFFFCVALCWRPIYSFALALLLTALLPAALGGGFSHPTGRRMLMMLPPIFFIAGLALERARVAFARAESPKLGGLLALTAMSLGVWVNVKSWDWYFNKYCKDQWVLSQRNQLVHQGAWTVRNNPDCEYGVGPLVNGFVAAGILFPRDTHCNRVGAFDDILLVQGQAKKDLVLALEPVQAPLAQTLKQLFPSVQTKVVPTFLTEAGPGSRDLLFSARIPLADMLAVRGMINAETGKPEPVFTQPVPLIPGKESRYKATLVMPHFGGDLTARLPWPGWKASLNGRPLPFDKPIKVNGGTHQLEIRGVPAQAAPLPLTLQTVNGELIATGHLLARDLHYPVQSEYITGPQAWTGKAEVTRTEPVLNRYIFDPMPLPVPFTVRTKVKIRVPEKGIYRFNSHRGTEGFLKVGNKIAWDNRAVRTQPVIEAIELSPDKPLELHFEYWVCHQPDCRLVELMVQAPGKDKEMVLPESWLEAL